MPGIIISADLMQRQVKQRSIPAVSLDGVTPVLQRVFAARGISSTQQLQHGLQLALAYKPSENQQATLEAFYNNTLSHYAEHPESIAALVPDSLPQQPATAALINTANVILNLDEFLNKP